MASNDSSPFFKKLEDFVLHQFPIFSVGEEDEPNFSSFFFKFMFPSIVENKVKKRSLSLPECIAPNVGIGVQGKGEQFISL